MEHHFAYSSVLRQFLPFRPDATPPRPRLSSEIHDSWKRHDGTVITIRAAGADDGPLMQALVHGLSLRSRYHRFFYPAHELTPDMLARFTQADPRGAFTLLAVVWEQDEEVAVGMAQYVATPYPMRGEFAVVINDAWQRTGIATRLLRNLICVARAAGIERLEGDILSENLPMLELMRRMGFTLDAHPDGLYLTKAWKALSVPEWNCSALAALASEGNLHRSRQLVHA